MLKPKQPSSLFICCRTFHLASTICVSVCVCMLAGYRERKCYLFHTKRYRIHSNCHWKDANMSEYSNFKDIKQRSGKHVSWRVKLQKQRLASWIFNSQHMEGFRGTQSVDASNALMYIANFFLNHEKLHWSTNLKPQHCKRSGLIILKHNSSENMTQIS